MSTSPVSRSRELGPLDPDPLSSRRPRRAVASAAVLAAVLVAGGLQATTYTVTTTADSGPGSLRQALADADAHAGGDVVAFAIPAGLCSAAGVCRITLSSPIVVNDTVVLDGTTQPRHGTAPANVCATAGSPSSMRIEVLGPGSGTTVLDLRSTTASTIRGLAVGTGSALYLNGGTGHTIQCNHFCLDGPGTAAMPGINGMGIVFVGAHGVLVGTDGDGVDDIGERNVFSGCGIAIYVNANHGNWIAGNYFGVGANGTTAINTSTGVFLRQSSARNLIGTNEDGVSDDLERNIFANGTYGVQFQTQSYAGSVNAVVGNWFGVNAAGGAAFLNTAVYGQDDAPDLQVLRGNLIRNNIYGISTTSAFATARTSMCNQFVGNGTAVAHGSSGLLALESSWWGSATGPGGSGPGTGDPVSVTGAGTIDYTPWLLAADAPCPYVFADGFDFGDTADWSAAAP